MNDMNNRMSLNKQKINYRCKGVQKMTYTLEMMHDILVEKQMADLYKVQKVTPYELPIIAYDVTIHFQAREKYSIFTEQLIRFLALSPLTEQQLQEIIGLEHEDFQKSLALLLADGVCMEQDGQLVLTEIGQESVVRNSSPLQYHQITFTCYYEPITKQFIEQMDTLLPRKHIAHPLVEEHVDECPFLEKESIQSFYTKITGKALNEIYDAIQINDVVYQSVVMNKVLPIQELCLLSRDQGNEVYSIWCPESNQFIRLT